MKYKLPIYYIVYKIHSIPSISPHRGMTKLMIYCRETESRVQKNSLANQLLKSFLPKYQLFLYFCRLNNEKKKYISC